MRRSNQRKALSSTPEETSDTASTIRWAGLATFTSQTTAHATTHSTEYNEDV